MDPCAVIKADQRIKAMPGLVRETPLAMSPALSDRTGVKVYLKCEHLQETGSFKLRGALNKVLSLTGAEKAKGIVTASSGNHGMAVALAAGLSRVRAWVYVPQTASALKIRTIEAYGAEVVRVSGDCLAAEMAALERARQAGRTYISPYNDEIVMAGQGTVGLEMLNQEPGLDLVFVSVGGGGLISGIGSYIKERQPDTAIVACWPENAPTMYHCLEQGRIVEVRERDTLSDGTAGGVEPDAVTFPVCQAVIDEKVLVSEEEIRAAMRCLAEHERYMVEGAAGVALAGCLKTAARYQGKKAAVVLCGRNILLEKFLWAVS